jgi:holo-[acyl-carrier protein] synthase
MPPPLPFPFPLRIGTDICQISRINGILHTKAGRRFVERVLAPEELSHLAHTRPVLAEQVKDAAFRYVRKAAAAHAGRRGWAVPPGVGHWEALEAAKKAAPRRPREVEREVEMKQKNEVGAEREVEAEREKEQDKEKAADWQAAVFMAGRWVFCLHIPPWQEGELTSV